MAIGSLFSQLVQAFKAAIDGAVYMLIVAVPVGFMLFGDSWRDTIFLSFLSAAVYYLLEIKSILKAADDVEEVGEEEESYEDDA